MVRFNRTMKSIPPSPTFVRLMQTENRIDGRTTSTWLPPGHFLNEVYAAPEGKGGANQTVQFHVNSSLIPETETSTHYFYAVTRNFPLQDDSIGPLLGSENAAAFQEYKMVIEEQQRMMQIESPPHPSCPSPLIVACWRCAACLKNWRRRKSRLRGVLKLAGVRSERLFAPNAILANHLAPVVEFRANDLGVFLRTIADDFKPNISQALLYIR